MGLGPENGRFRQDIPPLPPRENLYGVVPAEVKKRVHPSLRQSMIDFDEKNSAITESGFYQETSPFRVDSRLRWFVDRAADHWGKQDKKRGVENINGFFIDGVTLRHTLKLKLDGVKEIEMPVTLGFIPFGSNNGIIDISIPSYFPPVSQITKELAMATISNAINEEIVRAKNPPKDAVEFIRTPTPQTHQPAIV